MGLDEPYGGRGDLSRGVDADTSGWRTRHLAYRPQLGSDGLLSYQLRTFEVLLNVPVLAVFYRSIR